MAFTYLGTLATDRDKVRFHLGDTVEDTGPFPGDSNLTDAEIDGMVDDEGTWQRAVAAGFERLAASWLRYPSFKADGLSLNRSDIAKGYAEQAAQWRKQHGYTTPIYTAGQIPVDGYSDDVTTDDVDTSGEFESDFEYVTPD